MKSFQFFLLVVGCVIVAGCQTAKAPKSATETKQDVISAVEAIAGSINNGEELTDQEKEQLRHDLIHDPDARSAVEAITNAMGENQVVKYCPITGKRYAPHLEICPVHKVKLSEFSE